MSVWGIKAIYDVYRDYDDASEGQETEVYGTAYTDSDMAKQAALKAFDVNDKLNINFIKIGTLF